VPGRFILSAALCTGLVAVLHPPAHAQCEFEWKPGFGVTGISGDVHAMTVWDDGTGPALYVGGTFTLAGTVPAKNIAR